MLDRDFFIVDVFGASPYSGNQLAVLKAWPGLNSVEMQQIAAETNFSETTFIVAGQAGPAGWPVRIFTPAAEVPFAGHPTLGTAWVIAHHLASPGQTEVMLDLAVGQVPVRLASDGLLWMRQTRPVFGAEAPASLAAAAAGLSTDDLAPDGHAQMVSTGLPAVITPVVSLAALERAKPQAGAHAELMDQVGGRGQLLYHLAPGDGQRQVAMRFFAPLLGIAEDPATGSAAGCLAAHLCRHGLAGEGAVEALARQGAQVGRPSRLHLRAWAEDGGEIAVEVGGQVWPMAQGRWLAASRG